MKFLSIDTETTGLDSAKCDLLEVGLVVFDSQITYEQHASNAFRIVLCHEHIEGNVFAIDMNMKLISEIKRYTRVFKEKEHEGYIVEYTPSLTTVYVDMSRADGLMGLLSFRENPGLDALGEILKEWFEGAGITGKLNIAGKNYVGFDQKFLSKFPVFENIIVNNARHRVLDVGSMWFNPYEDDVLPNLAMCAKRAGLPEFVPHTAVEDAIIVAKVAQVKWGLGLASSQVDNFESPLVQF